MNSGDLHRRRSGPPRSGSGILLILVAATLLLASCSKPMGRIDGLPLVFDGASSLLTGVVISSWGEEKFSGLLGLMPQQEGLYYLLLDATGIKLLEAVVAPDGSHSVKNGLQKVTESGLPAILAQSLYAMYMVEPLSLPCSVHAFRKLCRETTEDGRAIKYLQTGPFTIWKVLYRNGMHASTVFSKPWLGLEIVLFAINEEKKR